MDKLTVLLILGLISCGRAERSSSRRSDYHTAQSGEESRIRKKNSADSVDKYDTSIYERYLATELKEYLNNQYKGWTFPAPNRWDTVWFNQYKTDTSLLSYVSGDFDCNERKDYAIIFKKADGFIAAYAFLSRGNYFLPVELMNFGKDEGEQIEIGLEVLPPGVYNYIDADNDEDVLPHVKIKCNSVQILNFERAAETFYWEKGKLKSISTGD
jgi:hypothetical protein